MRQLYKDTCQNTDIETSAPTIDLAPHPIAPDLIKPGPTPYYAGKFVPTRLACSIGLHYIEFVCVCVCVCVCILCVYFLCTFCIAGQFNLHEYLSTRAYYQNRLSLFWDALGPKDGHVRSAPSSVLV